MILTHTGQRFEILCNSTEVSWVEAAGFKNEKKTGRWFTKEAVFAKKFADFAQPEAREVIRLHNQRVLFSYASTADINVPCPPGLKYFDFQRAGISYSQYRDKIIVGDGMRLGKTVQLIGRLNLDTTIKNILIITEASLKINWEREFTKWMLRELSVQVIPAEWNYITKHNIIITNYENVPKLRSQILERDWHLIGIDEFHCLGNPYSKRTKNILGSEWNGHVEKFAIPAERYMFLSGTPITKRPVNLWPIVRMADRTGLGSDWYDYTRRYCGGWEAPWGWDASRATNLDEFQERLRSTIMIRRVREDVLDQLPPICRQLITLPTYKILQQLRGEIEEVSIKAKQIADAQIGDDESFFKAVRNLDLNEDNEFSSTSKLRRMLAEAKIPYIVEILKNVLDQEEKAVLFAHHTSVIEGVRDKFLKEGVVCHYGKITDTKKKQEAIDRFQDDPKCRLFIGAITGAKGYSVAKASYALFAEYDWRSTYMRQAEDRIWLIDKMDSLHYQYAVFDGSLDATMARQYIKTEETIGKALDKGVI